MIHPLGSFGNGDLSPAILAKNYVESKKRRSISEPGDPNRELDHLLARELSLDPTELDPDNPYGSHYHTAKVDLSDGASTRAGSSRGTTLTEFDLSPSNRSGTFTKM